MQSTEWRPIPRYEGRYEASSDGQIRSIERVVVDHGGRGKARRERIFQSRIRRQFDNGRGYLVLNFLLDGKKKQEKVHRLVASAFHGMPSPGSDACHNNGDRTDNRAENLRWDTRSGNLLDRAKHGTHYQSAKTHCDYGHEFTPENTRRIGDGLDGAGFRQCRECVRRRSLDSKHRKSLNKARLANGATSEATTTEPWANTPAANPVASQGYSDETPF